MKVGKKAVPLIPPKRGPIWLTVIGANVLVAAMGVALMAISWRDFDQKAKEASELRMRGLKQSIELRLGRLRVTQEVVVHELERQLAHDGVANKEELDEVVSRFDFDGLKSKTEGLYTLRVTDERGDIISGYGVSVRPVVNYADREYFKTLRDNPAQEMSMSKLLVGKVSNKPTVVFAMKYKRPNGDFAGVVIAAASQDSLLEIAGVYQGAVDDLVAIRDRRDLSVLARIPRVDSDQGVDAQGHSKMAPGIHQKMLAGMDSGFEKSGGPIEGQSRSMSFAKVHGAPIYAVVGVGRDTFFGPWRAQVWTATIFFMAFLAMSVALGRKSIESQKRTAKAQGDYLDLNERLERQVEARTADLSQAAELIRKSRDELAESDRLASLGAMVSTVAHELNTPLGNALLSNSAIVEQSKALREQVEQGSAKRSEMVRGLERLMEMSTLQAQAIESAAELVKSFKQVAVDQSSERRREFDAGEAIQAVVSSLGPSLRRSKARIDVALDLPGGLRCDTYPGALAQICSNIIQNAQSHAFEGRESGRVSIKARAVERAGEPWISVEFSDDGVGMDKEVSSHAFDVFFTTKASSGGSGIGLALSRKLAERALGGKLWLGTSLAGVALVLEFPAQRR